LRILITGAIGFIGSALTRNLVDSGHEVIALTRKLAKNQPLSEQNVTYIEWDATTSRGWVNNLEGSDVIINLAGANLSEIPWSAKVKRTILESRVNTGKAIVQAIMRVKHKPKLLIQQSASGFYGSRGDQSLTELSKKGRGFLADVCEQWENSTKMVVPHGLRRVILRTGVVIGRGAKFLNLTRIPFLMFVGGHPGDGNNWIPWIHLDDVVNVIQFLIDNGDKRDIFNLSAPESVNMKQFFKQYGEVLNRSSWLHPPEFALKFVLGDMAKEMIFVSQRMIPQRLIDSGYKFIFPELKPALQQALA
jgi:uncharacterized protein (TIGR01777 family)